MPAKYTVVTEIPDCDICKIKRNPPIKAYADAFIRSWSTWGNVCKDHFQREGCELGVGMGQEFKLSTDQPEQSQTERIKEAVKDIDWDAVSYGDLEDIFEDRDPAEFL